MMAFNPDFDFIPKTPAYSPEPGYRASEREDAPIQRDPFFQHGGERIVIDNPNIPTPTDKPQTDTTTQKYTTPDGKVFTDVNAYNLYMQNYNTAITNNAITAQKNAADKKSAYDLLYSEFSKYGLGTLVSDVKDFLINNYSPSEMSIALQNTEAYKDRFKANESRIKAGLRALTPAEYTGLEDQYQNIMRNYGLPASYYAKDSTGKQAGFEKFIAGDVSATELEDRINTAQSRVLNSSPEIINQLKAYYPEITDGDVLAYALDPKNALISLKRKVTAAEIGGAAWAAGLNQETTEEAYKRYAARAEQLAGAGITGAAAKQAYGTIAELAQRGSQLAAIYGEQPYSQTQAEQELFNLAGGTESAKARKKLTELEKSKFGGSSGASSSALSRDRASAYAGYREPGAGAF